MFFKSSLYDLKKSRYRHIEILSKIELNTILSLIPDELLNKKTIISSTRITAMDHWLSYLAWIYDYNFTPSLEYVEEKGLIDGVLDRIDYKDSDTKTKMDYARKTLHQYISERIR